MKKILIVLSIFCFSIALSADKILKPSGIKSSKDKFPIDQVRIKESATSDCPGPHGKPCNNHGTCTSAKKCECYNGFSGDSCDRCATDYYAYPSCNKYCNSSYTCSGHGTCTNEGSCSCNNGFCGPYCNSCCVNHYAYPKCRYCSSQDTCRGHGTCNNAGECSCDIGYTGINCDQCASGYRKVGASCIK